MANAFDHLRILQNEFKSQSREYEFFVRTKLLTEIELKKLLRWYMDIQRRGVVDNDAAIRIAICRQLPADAVLPFFDVNEVDSYPKKLRKYLRQRFYGFPWKK
jgi:hypothetical protein